MADARPKGRWLRIALVLSLALNLAVVAAVVGAAWRFKGVEGAGPRQGGGGVLYLRALPEEDRRVLREALRATPRVAPVAARMVEVLRAEPFDASAAAGLLETERAAGLQRQDIAADVWLERVTRMSTQERAAYADRLQALLERRKDRGKSRD